MSNEIKHALDKELDLATASPYEEFEHRVANNIYDSKADELREKRKSAILDAIANKQPFHPVSADALNIKMPESYERNGDYMNDKTLAVYKPKQDVSTSPKEASESEVAFDKWAESYALGRTIVQLERELIGAKKDLSKASASHLAAIERTSSMQSQSQARAQAGNVVRATAEKKRMLERAIEIAIAKTKGEAE